MFIAKHVRPAGLLPLSQELIGPVFRIPRGAVTKAGGSKFRIPTPPRASFDDRAAAMKDRMLKKRGIIA